MIGTPSPPPHRGQGYGLLALRQMRAWAGAAAELLFLGGGLAGTVIFLVLLWQPQAALCGILALGAAWFTARLTQLDDQGLVRSVPAFNALLAGLAVAHYWPDTALAYAWALAAGAAALLLSHALMAMLTDRSQLPVLSLPFVGLSWMLHALAPSAASLAWSGETAAPTAVAQGLQALGGVLYLPQTAAGAVLAILILWYSRVLFLLAWLGYALGLSLHLALGGGAQDAALFNYPLVAMAIGGYFLLPSGRSVVLAGLAVACCAVLLELLARMLSPAGLPVHALPYNLATLLMLAALGRTPGNELRREWRTTPEAAIEAAVRERARGETPTLGLPCSGRWMVWQGFDGAWTHQGPWRYGIDFVVVGDDGYSFTDTGTELRHYHSWLQPVLSPLRGAVVAARGDLPDSPPGVADTLNNWGNYVIVRDDRGFFVEISHLAQNSLTVVPGMRVEPGDMLGRCGNSGYAIYPHVHLQVQGNGELGAATLPCRFLSSDERGRIAARTPRQGEVLEALPALSTAGIDWHLGETFHYLEVGTRRAASLVVRAAEDGRLFLEAPGARLWFARDGLEWRLLEYEGEHPFFSALARALPGMPLCLGAGASWSECVPVSWCLRGWRLVLAQAAMLFHRGYARASYEARCSSAEHIQFSIAPPLGPSLEGEVHFDHNGLFAIRVGTQRWRRAAAEEMAAYESSHNPWWPLAAAKTEPS